jgi:hypothetical protein
MLPIATNTTQTPRPTKSAKAIRHPKSTLNKYIAEALQLEKEKMEKLAAKLPGVAPPIWPAWPYWDSGTTHSAVSKELGTLDDSIREIQWRLKQVRYPYQGGTTRNRKTLYERAKALGILGKLVQPPLLSEIRRFWWFQKHDQYNYELKKNKKSEYGLPLAVHYELVFELSAHLAKLETLVKAHKPKTSKTRNKWLETFYEYRRATLKQILNEAALFYPQIQYRLIPAAQINNKDDKIPAQVALFTSIGAVLKGNDVPSNKFAFHLTSAICTPKKSVRKRRLSPTPETVRTNIEGWLRQAPKLASGKSRKLPAPI